MTYYWDTAFGLYFNMGPNFVQNSPLEGIQRGGSFSGCDWSA